MWWHLEESEEGVRKQTIWELLPKVVRLFGPHRKMLYLSFLYLIPITAGGLAGPYILGYVIDVNIAQGDIPGLARTAGLWVLLVAISTGFGYIQSITLFHLGINILTHLKARMFNHILHLGLDFHENHPPGKLISRVESDTETLKQLFADVAVNLTRSALFFIGTLVVLFLKDFTIAIWILLLVPFFFAATVLFLVKMRKYWREVRVQWAIVLSYVTEYVQGIEVIRQFNYQNRARERMHDVNMGKFRVEVPAYFFEYGFWGALIFGEIIAFIVVLLVGFKRTIAGQLEVGTLVMIFEYIRTMFFPIMMLTEQLNFIQRGLISVERVFGILETKPAVEDGPEPAEDLTFDSEIVFENVWFAYEEENWILKDLSFRIPKGNKIALVGTSGGGKSTVINLLLRFYDPQKGRITVDGRDIRDFPIKTWREHIGLVLQDIYLFPGSVEDNLRVFDKMIDRQRIKEVAEIARADTIIEKLPGGYEGELAERGSNLSFGERQLMSFARALVYNPPLLVLDEATSSVDPHTERLVQEALDRLLSGRTAVIVAHRLSTIINADRIILIHNGIITESGKHEELLDLDGLYAKLFKLQFQDVGVGSSRMEEAS